MTFAMIFIYFILVQRLLACVSDVLLDMESSAQLIVKSFYQRVIRHHMSFYHFAIYSLYYVFVLFVKEIQNTCTRGFHFLKTVVSVFTIYSKQ